VGASVRARLLQLAMQRGDDFQLLLTRYANERLLYRLTKSQHAGLFLLKGAALFTLWTGHAHRATRDMDLLGFGEPSVERLRAVFTEVVALDVDDDGVVFDTSSLKVEPVRQDHPCDGIRLVMIARPCERDRRGAPLPAFTDVGERRNQGRPRRRGRFCQPPPPVAWRQRSLGARRGGLPLFAAVLEHREASNHR
jgi:hypothetical protein